MSNKRIWSLFFIAPLMLVPVGCGSDETAVPAASAPDQQKMDDYYKKLEEAEKKGIDPATIPAP